MLTSLACAGDVEMLSARDFGSDLLKIMESLYRGAVTVLVQGRCTSLPKCTEVFHKSTAANKAHRKAPQKPSTKTLKALTL